jgi:hypothetical protein
MRITERMGLVYTALFLTVSVAVITQNSEALMAAFRGQSHVVAVDDIYTVEPGRDLRLTVLANDVAAHKVTNTQIRINSQPDCGTIKQVGGSFLYSGSGSCVNNQEFTYCLETGGECDVARVVLKFENTRPTIDSIATGPITELEDLGAQAGINSGDLEITNVHLGKASNKSAPTMPATGMKLVKVALETPVEITRPAPLTKQVDVSGTFAMETPAPFGRKTETREIVEVASIDDTLPDAGTNMDRILVPSSPEMTAALPHLAPVDRKGIVAHLAGIELGNPEFGTRAVYDLSPFGTPCTTNLESQLVDGGMVELALNAPCHPNSRVEIRHGKLSFTSVTGHTGTLNVTVPALEESAVFMVSFTDGTRLKTRRDVPGLENIERVALQYDGKINLTLHALEFGARPGSDGDVSSNEPRSLELALKYGGGYIIRLGDGNVNNPVLAQIYSLPIDLEKPDGVIELMVEASANADNCTQNGVLRSHHSKNGRLVGSSGYRFELPECGNTTQSIVLNNVLRDLIIARN